MQDRHDQAHPQHGIIAQVFSHHVREQVPQVLWQHHQASKSSSDGVLTDLFDVERSYHVGAADAETDYCSGCY